MQRILVIVIFSFFGIISNAQEYARGYTQERLELTRELLNPNCAGTQDYCDCIIEGVTTRVPFNQLRKPESAKVLQDIIRSCQEKHRQFPFDPFRPAALELNAKVVMNARSKSTVYGKDTIRVEYTLKNTGLGTSYVPSLIVNVSGSEGNDISYDNRNELTDLTTNDSHSGTINIIPKTINSDDSITIKIEAIDGLKYRSNAQIYSLWSLNNDKKNYSFYPDVVPMDRRNKVTFEIVNTGSAPIRQPRVYFQMNQDIYIAEEQWVSKTKDNEFELEIVKLDPEYRIYSNVFYPGEIIRGDFFFSPLQSYDEDDISLKISITDNEGWNQSKSDVLIADYSGFVQKINSHSIAANTSLLIKSSAVDEVKSNYVSDDSKFAVIVGNQHYQSDDVYDVAFANRDAQVFKKYCTNVLGVPEKNLRLILDGTVGTMNQALNSIANMAEQRSKPIVYFYYAGHGWPNKAQEPLLIPSDIGVNQLENAIKLNSVTAKFRRNANTELIAFVDACYASDNFSKKTRSFVIEVREPLVSGNQVLFSAVSKNQEANQHEESRHGLFTYYLLKALKEKKKLTIEELDEYLRINVTDYINLKSGLKNQTPTVHIPEELSEIKSKWRIVD